MTCWWWGWYLDHYWNTHLVKTTTQLYGVPHGKAKVTSCLLHKIHSVFKSLMTIINEHTCCDWLNLWAIICRLRFTDYGSGMVSCEQQNVAGVLTIIDYQKFIWNIHIISCYLCFCKHSITQLGFMKPIKKFSTHMVVVHPYQNHVHSKGPWCHCFIDSSSPKHKDLYGLTLSQVKYQNTKRNT